MLGRKIKQGREIVLGGLQLSVGWSGKSHKIFEHRSEGSVGVSPVNIWGVSRRNSKGESPKVEQGWCVQRTVRRPEWGGGWARRKVGWISIREVEGGSCRARCITITTHLYWVREPLVVYFRWRMMVETMEMLNGGQIPDECRRGSHQDLLNVECETRKKGRSQSQL